MVNGRNGSTVVRRKFQPAVKRFNKRTASTFPINLPKGQKGRMMRISEAERRVIKRSRSQTKGIRNLRSRGLRRIG